MIASEILLASAGTGVMPSSSDLKSRGQNDLACVISKNGGFITWAERLGLCRKHSDSDTGWRGEQEVLELFNANGAPSERLQGVQCPFDLLVFGCIKVDVKTTNYSERGPCRGWFYRIGKYPQSDLICLYQLDTKDFYLLHWEHVPKTNVTISRDGGKYKAFKNRFDLLCKYSKVMSAARSIWYGPNLTSTTG